MARKRYYSHSKLATLEYKGVHLAESERFKGVLYKPEKDGLTIYARQSGELAFKCPACGGRKREVCRRCLN